MCWKHFNLGLLYVPCLWHSSSPATVKGCRCHLTPSQDPTHTAKAAPGIQVMLLLLVLGKNLSLKQRWLWAWSVWEAQVTSSSRHDLISLSFLYSETHFNLLNGSSASLAFQVQGAIHPSRAGSYLITIVTMHHQADMHE